MKGMALPFLIKDTDRHGNVRYYVRKPGCAKVRIRESLGTEAFFQAYSAALGTAVLKEISTSDQGAGEPGTLLWLCRRYMVECADYRTCQPSTRHARKLTLE